MSLSCLWIVAVTLMPEGDAPTYERDVRPILQRRCVPCHSVKHLDDPDTSGGLALDSFDAALRGTAKHRVVTPGVPSRSVLFGRLVESDDDLRMPQNEEPLDAGARDLIRRWIDDGAPRGVAVVENAKPSRPARRIARTTDVTIPLPSASGASALRIKAGPLPAASAVAFSVDGKTLAVGTHGQVTLWDLAKRSPTRVLGDTPGPVLALAFSPDGKTLAVGSGLPARSGLVRLYATPEGTFLRALDGHKDVVSALAFRPDGKAIASSSYDSTVRTWDVATGKPAGTFKGHSDFVYDVAYLPDGKSLLSASKDRTVKRIDATTMTELRTYGEHDDDVLALAVRPDGTGFFSTGNEPAIRSWTIDAEKSSRRTGGHSGPVHQVATSRDGKRVASASGDGSVRLFDGPDLGSPRTLPGPTEWQYAVAISPDGRRVAGGGWDGLVRVWDAAGAKLDMTLVQPPSRDDEPCWLAVMPDGSVAGSDDLRASVRWVVDGKETHKKPKAK